MARTDTAAPISVGTEGKSSFDWILKAEAEFTNKTKQIAAQPDFILTKKQYDTELQLPKK